jgi:hypothetical protein
MTINLVLAGLMFICFSTVVVFGVRGLKRSRSPGTGERVLNGVLVIIAGTFAIGLVGEFLSIVWDITVPLP